MTEVFPGLSGLKGGKKQVWVNANLELITLLNDQLGFDQTCRMLYMKAGTLSSALKKAEGRHRPTVTLAQKAMSRVLMTDGRLEGLGRVVHEQGEILETHLADDYRLRANLSNYFGLLAQANALMQELIMSTTTKGNDPNFTYHIGRASKHKVGPSTNSRSVRLLHYTPGRTNYPARLKESHRHSKPSCGRRQRRV